MSAGGTGQGALYSPLPQSISDTDSSEEELISVVHHNDNRKVVNESVEKRNGPKMGDYRPLGHDNEPDVATNGFPSRGSTAAIAAATAVPIKSDGTIPQHLEPMSPIRKVCFVLSILLCGLTIVVFLWVLPCEWATCPSAPRKSGTKTWEKVLHNIELKGGISVVSGVSGRSRNLVFLMRGDALSAPDLIPGNGGGIISLVGATGAVAWWTRLISVPQEVDCALIDVTQDDTKDCLINGADFLAAVDPLSGSAIWYLHSHKGLWQASNVEFPLVLPDLNADGVEELVTACNIKGKSLEVTDHKYLLLISGKTGMAMGEPLMAHNCTSINSLDLLSEINISYTCQGITSSGKASTIVQISIQELYTKTTKKPLAPTLNLTELKPLKQHISFSRKKDSDSRKSSHYSIGNRSLLLDNQGHCPSHCTATVQLMGPGNHVVWKYTGNNAYATVPATLVFGGSSGTSPENISGFVLKLWQWNVKHGEGNEVAESSTNPLFRSRLKRNSEGNRTPRSVVPALKQTLKCSNITAHQLNERVVLVTFNASATAKDIHIVNTSQSILQLCAVVEGPGEPLFCQPDLTYQEQSLLIADLDDDGSQELISYLSTYVGSSPKWQLQSRVRVIQLEAELPKLYEALAHL